MSRRVVISAGVFKMAPAGLDALTAGPDQLLFDANGAPYNGAWMAGRIYQDAFSETSQGISNGGTQYTRTFVLNFGKTFSSPPRVLFGALDPNNGGLYTPNLNLNSITQGSTSGSITGAGLNLSASIETYRATFTVTYVKYSDDLNRFADVAYVVFQV